MTSEHPGEQNTRVAIYINRAIESLWLAAAFMVPLAMAPSDWMISQFGLPKVAVLRILVSFMVVLWIIEWAISARNLKAAPFFVVQRGSGLPSPHTQWLQAFRDWVRQEPVRWIHVAAALFMSFYVLSSVLSASARISVWGGFTFIDGFSLYNMAAYYLLFLVMATRLRTKAQLLRLFGAIVAAGGFSAVLGVLERLEWIPLGTAFTLETRIESTFGNAIFFGAFLVMSIPLTLGLYSAAPARLRGKGYMALWPVLLGIQFLALALTFSRGPWTGLAFGVIAFFAIGAFVLDRQALFKSGAMLVVSLALALLALQAIPPRPEADDMGNVEALQDRVLSIYPQVAGGGLSHRVEIWNASTRLFLGHPWIPGEELSLAGLRWLVGYGPDLYSYVFPLEGTSLSGAQMHAHNHVIHEAVETGILGAIGYMFILAAAAAPGAYMLFRQRDHYDSTSKAIFLTVIAVLTGRIVEQMVGIPRAGDFMVFWMMLGAVVALPAIAGGHKRTVVGSSPQMDTLVRQRRLLKVALAGVIVVALAWTVLEHDIIALRADILAARAASKDDLPEAMALVGQAIALKPDLPVYYERRADIISEHLSSAESSGAWTVMAEMAYADRVRAMQADPLSVTPRLKRADAALELARAGYEGKGEEGIQLYNEVISMTPHYNTVHSHLRSVIAIGYIYLGQPETALRVVDEALAREEFERVRARLLYVRGAALYESGRPDEAIESLEQSTEVGIDNEVTAQAHALLAKLYGDAGQAALYTYHIERHLELMRVMEQQLQ